MALELRRRKRIACREFALCEAGCEPALALFRRAMREGVGNDAPLRLFLQRIVADGARGLQRSIDIAGIEKSLRCSE